MPTQTVNYCTLLCSLLSSSQYGLLSSSQYGLLSSSQYRFWSYHSTIEGVMSLMSGILEGLELNTFSAGAKLP